MKFKNLKTVTVFFTFTAGNEGKEFTRNISVPFTPDVCVLRSFSMTHATPSADYIYGMRTNLEFENNVITTFRASPTGTVNNIFKPNTTALQQATFQLIQASYPNSNWVPAFTLGNGALAFIIEFYQFERPLITMTTKN